MSGRGASEFKDAGITADSDLLKQVMEKFDVDEKKANQIIAFTVCMALDKMRKWTSNIRKAEGLSHE